MTVAHKKKPVDRTPIADSAYLRRIDPLWMPGKAPFRFWQDVAHRRDYLLWLGHRLRFRYMEDFYRLNHTMLYGRNYGGGLRHYWGQSALVAVEDCFSEYDWKPWLFTQVSSGFWDLPANQRSYMNWLGERLGYQCIDDWYQVTVYDFRKNKGNTLLSLYHGSTAQVVSGVLSGQTWYEWKFHNVPPGFWEVAENRHRYLRWLGKELGFRKPEDWYQIQIADIIGRCGQGLVKRYSSYFDLMREFLPQLDWDQIDKHQPIRIEDVLAWADAHFAKHGTWPTGDLGEIPGTGQSWSRIHSCLRYGFRGLPGGTTLTEFLEKHRGVHAGRRPPHLSEKQVLDWADAYFAAHGKWPTQKSGPILGTRETWGAVSNAMHLGCRGFQRGSSFAQLLAEHRGTRNRKRLPQLNEKQILTWAKAYFKATGRWPYDRSGPVAQSPGDTWCGVAQALIKGNRGLPGGSSLHRLLQKHGLK